MDWSRARLAQTPTDALGLHTARPALLSQSLALMAPGPHGGWPLVLRTAFPALEVLFAGMRRCTLSEKRFSWQQHQLATTIPQLLWEERFMDSTPEPVLEATSASKVQAPPPQQMETRVFHAPQVPTAAVLAE